ncbi:MAG: TRAP transporter small permease, partial [Aquincola tertiaricarbonis]
VMLGWGAWQQVVVGMDSRSVVLQYPVMLLPLPALLCAVSSGVMALIELVRGRPLDLGHSGDVE